MRRLRKIVLISPKGPLYRHRGGIFKRSLRYMPLTLPTLAALVPPGLAEEVICIDEGIGDVDPGVEADLVGLTVLTGTAPRAYELAASFRRRGVPVVLGGPHVTLAPDDAQSHADFIVVGYAEEEWPRLLCDLIVGDPKPRYTQASDFSLAGFPCPDRSVLPRGRYLTDAVFEATRGCVHDCEFCVVPAAWGRRPFHKPIDEVVDDIRTHRARRAVFVDLNLIADPEYAADLFTALIPLEIEWYGLATTLLAGNLRLLDLAAESGCRGLLMGLESVSPQSLRGCGKGFNHPDDYGELVRRLHERQIALQGCFVFGLDGDTREVFLDTARLAIEARIDLPRFAIATPFPGTGLYRRLLAEDRILTRDWKLYDGQHAVFQPQGMTPAELERGTEAAWRHAYSVSGICNRLRSTAAHFRVALAANLGYRYYARRLKHFYTCDWPLATGQQLRVSG